MPRWWSESKNFEMLTMTPDFDAVQSKVRAKYGVEIWPRGDQLNRALHGRGTGLYFVADIGRLQDNARIVPQTATWIVQRARWHGGQSQAVRNSSNGASSIGGCLI